MAHDVGRVFEIRPEPPPRDGREVRVMIGGKPYLVGISDLRGGLKPLANPNELQRSFQGLVDKTSETFRAKVNRDLNTSSSSKYSKLELEFSKTHEFQQARFFKASSENAEETINEIEEIFDDTIAQALERDEVPVAFQKKEDEDVLPMSGKDKERYDLSKTMILNVTVDENGLVTEVNVPKKESLIPETPGHEELTPAVDMTPYIRDCGGNGNCGPLSLVYQMRRSKYPQHRVQHH